jgi:membrane protease YdiL (CAAX protease family)
MEDEVNVPVEPSTILGKTPWPLRDLAFGILIPIAYYALGHLNLLKYKPWIAVPFYFALYIFNALMLILYSLYICKKRGFWPVLEIRPSSKLLKEFLKSLPIVLLIMLVIGLTGLLLEVILKREIGTPGVWQWATYAPNSILLVIVLILAFTLGPVVEEIFFRGFLYNGLKTRFPALIAASFQAVIFSAIHGYELLNSVLIFLLGIALAIVYEKRQTLLSPIFVHGMINAIWAIPLLILTLQNFHTPAMNWNEAQTRPSWFKAYPSEEIERQKDGMEQWQYAINKWGSKGSRQWKKEANAFNALCMWFPEDRTACAKAKLGIAAIYVHYLRDYRRGIVEANDLLSQYPDQEEQCASVLSEIGLAYLMLKDFKNSRISFERVINDFRDHKDALESAQKGIKWLNDLEGK